MKITAPNNTIPIGSVTIGGVEYKVIGHREWLLFWSALQSLQAENRALRERVAAIDGLPP